MQQHSRDANMSRQGMVSNGIKESRYCVTQNRKNDHRPHLTVIATSEEFWPMRRNIGTSWDHRLRQSGLNFSRPVDKLTRRLAKGARLRSFISLTNSPICQALVPSCHHMSELDLLLLYPLSASFHEAKKTPRLNTDICTGTRI